MGLLISHYIFAGCNWTKKLFICLWQITNSVRITMIEVSRCSLGKFTLTYFGIVWRLTDREVMDVRTFCNDFIHLGHNMGVFFYDDLLSIMSICYQTIHSLLIRDAGTFVDVRAIGTYCHWILHNFSML